MEEVHQNIQTTFILVVLKDLSLDVLIGKILINRAEKMFLIFKYENLLNNDLHKNLLFFRPKSNRAPLGMIPQKMIPKNPINHNNNSRSFFVYTFSLFVSIFLTIFYNIMLLNFIFILILF